VDHAVTLTAHEFHIIARAAFFSRQAMVASQLLALERTSAQVTRLNRLGLWHSGYLFALKASGRPLLLL
jgi:hypothetical protein